MLTYLLFAIVLIYLLILLINTKGDLFYPPVIICLVFCISLIFVFYKMDEWDAAISGRTFVILTIGVTSYMVGAIFAERITKKIKWSGHDYCTCTYRITTGASTPQIDPLVTMIIIVAECIIMIKYYYDVKRSASYIGEFNDIGTMIGLYRDAGVFGYLEVGISKFSSYGYMAMTALAYLYLYMIIANVIVKKKRVTVGWLGMNVTPIILFCGCSILAGGRNPLIQLLVAAFMMTYLLQHRICDKGNGINIKLVIRLTVITMIALMAFSSMRGLVGRADSEGFIDYIAKYVGAPIKLFDMFVEDPPIKQYKLWGKETFVNIWVWVGGLIKNNTLTSLLMNKEFRTYNNVSLGNVYTAFREYYADFGISGVIVLPFIHSNLFVTYYNKIRDGHYRLRTGQFDIPLIIYSYISISLAYYSIDDRLYQKFLSRGTFRELLLLVIFASILPRLKGVNNSSSASNVCATNTSGSYT